MRERRRVGDSTSNESAIGDATPVPGRQSLTQDLAPVSGGTAAVQYQSVNSANVFAQPHITGPTLAALFGSPVQRAASHASTRDAAHVHAAATQGISGPAIALPHLDQIQRAFGRHDVGHIQAHVGGPATAGAHTMGAEAFATGDHVAFAGSPSLHLAAHEAAHVVQQRAGVQLAGGVGQSGDVYEQHADAVADKVVRGESAEDLLGRYGPPSPGAGGNDSEAKCPTCGGSTDSNGGCTSCIAKPAATARQGIQRSPEPASRSSRQAAGLRPPRSLGQTLAPTSLSDDEIVNEIDAIRAWFAAQSTSSNDFVSLALALGQLAHELVTRHPGLSLPATAPRPASSITAEDVRRASAGALGVMLGAGFAAPGIAPAPPPMPIPPPMPVPPVTPPVVAPPVAPPSLPPPPVEIPPVAAGPRPLPVPPIAAGILAFLLVLLWPSDSIESGAEERRKLEEYHRRQRQPQPPTAGAAGPAPSPVPPLGEGPHERRRPEQTCENQLLDTLQKQMHEVCDQIPGESCSPRKVSPKKLARRPCSQIRRRIAAVRDCIRLRQGIQDQCFGGAPDPAHANVLAELQSGLNACLELEAVNCTPGHPMADL